MSKARAKGTAWESELVPILSAVFGLRVERAPLKGQADHGDFVNVPYLVEAKKTNQPRFLEWARIAARKAAGAGWVIIWAGDRRKGDGPYVIMPLDQWASMQSEITSQRIRETGAWPS
jgi:hypothetical protein